MIEADTSAIQELRADLATFKGETNTALSNMNAELRVQKHDMANFRMGFEGHMSRMEKSQSEEAKESKEFRAEMRKDLTALKDQIVAVNTKQEKGFGFFAGIAFVFTVPLAAIVAVIKLLPSG